MNGIINCIKPSHMTSHDVVSFMRRTLGQKKIGHTGTLDPMAVGVLPICIGKGTKVVEHLMNDQKTYRCHMVLGSATDTQDRWGIVTQTSEVTASPEAIEAALMTFVGTIEQVPPMYSALKVDGKKLVDLAREGIEVERQPRSQVIHSIVLHWIQDQSLCFDVTCSKGTYVRTICHDLGLKLGTFGHMTQLVRVASGGLTLSDAYTLEEIRHMAASGRSLELLKGVDTPFMDLTSISLDEWAFQKVSHGVKIDLKGFLKAEAFSEQRFRVYFEDRFVGLCGWYEGTNRLQLTDWFYCGDE